MVMERLIHSGIRNNATVDLVMLDWGTWEERFNTAINAGEKIDIAFTADWYGYLDSVVTTSSYHLMIPRIIFLKNMHRRLSNNWAKVS